MKHSLRDRDAFKSIAATSTDPLPRVDGEGRFVPTGKFVRAMAIVAGVLVPLMLASPAQTQVPRPITMTMQQSLQFGTIAGDGTMSGSVTINPTTGVKTVIGVYNMGGIHSPARFRVRGEKNTPVYITLPASVTLISGANSMTLNAFTSDPMGMTVLGNNRRVDVNVGATLQVNANQPAGIYTGIFDFTVNY